MLLNSLQPMMAWAEDRATVRTDPSADPGAKIGGGAAARRPAPSLRDWHQSDKPSQQDAAISPTGCRSQLANLETTEFQFTVNQDTPKRLGARAYATADDDRTVGRDSVCTTVDDPPWQIT